MAMQLHRSDTDIVLGAPYLNREAEDLETVGLFWSRFRFASSIASIIPRVSWLRCKKPARTLSLMLFPGTILSKLPVPKRREMTNHPLLDIMVTFYDHGAGVGSKQMSIKGHGPIITHTEGSKFLLFVEFSASEDSCQSRDGPY
ncbi:hypothetical protein RRF57_012376 [Xylaria bambusicola]|uniref:Uncharacterized protein n=1 Tax=Xylaria bambusicola TaxID=326684 RepID=A0AAN7V5J9_9PEZI